MTSIAIRIEDSKADTPRFRAVAGNRQAVGRTMGEALDALTADWGDDIQETAVFIQRFEPDAYFTAVQYHRMQNLLARRATLTAEERGELEALIDAELDATIARTDGVSVQPSVVSFQQKQRQASSDEKGHLCTVLPKNLPL